MGLGWRIIIFQVVREGRPERSSGISILDFEPPFAPGCTSSNLVPGI